MIERIRRPLIDYHLLNEIAIWNTYLAVLTAREARSGGQDAHETAFIASERARVAMILNALQTSNV